ASGAGLSDLTLSIGACCFVDCLRNIHHPRHPAPSKISAATPEANRHTAQCRRGLSRRDRAPLPSWAKDGALGSSSSLSCWNSFLILASSRFIADFHFFHQSPEPLFSPFVMSARRAERNSHYFGRLRQTEVVIKDQLQDLALSSRQFNQRPAK